MKRKSNFIAFTFIVTLLFIVSLCHNIFLQLAVGDIKYFTSLQLTKDFVIIILSGLIFRFIINRNDKSNKEILDKIKDYNEEVKLTSERYDIVAKATSDTVWDWNLDNNRFLWNKGIQGVFGYKKEDVGNTSNWWFENIHPEDSIKMSVRLYSFLEQKSDRWQDEYRFKCADGSYKYVFDRGFLVKDENGKPIRMIGAMQDITQKKEEEHRLKLLETVITETKESVIITDNDYSEGLPFVTFTNPSFTRMTGYTASNNNKFNLSILFGPESDEYEIFKLSNAIKNFNEYTSEIKCYTSSGTSFWMNISIVPVTNKDGEFTHWISIQRDVTEQKEQEREREQLIRELTQNNKDLKQFSYITSHNFRAPLSNLTGLLMLLDDIEIDNEELKEILIGFRKSTHLLNETIEDLVKVVIIKDNPSIQKENVHVKDVFENVFFQLNNQINLHKPKIKIDIPDNATLNINKAYLESIILNIVSNAIKYRSSTRSPLITISTENTEETLILSITDNGIGIDMEKNKDKIFGLYQRFHNHPDSKGLGLYLVKSQVEAMNGSIEVESEVDKGTSFKITFHKY